MIADTLSGTRLAERARTPAVSLHHRDSIDLLRMLPTSCIDAAVTDPPYDTDLNPDTCSWDVWPGLEFWAELARVVKPTGIMAFTISPHLAHERLSEILKAGWRVLEVGFWVYGSGRPVAVTRLKRSYDLVYFCSCGTRHLHTQHARGAYSPPDGPAKARGGTLGRQFRGGSRGKTPYVPSKDGYFPANVACEVGSEAFGASAYERIFAVKKVTGAERAKHWHPTVKPVDLMAQAVKLASREGEIILDPFMGSGTTGVASVLTGRMFVGIEQHHEYYEIARERILSVRQPAAVD